MKKKDMVIPVVTGASIGLALCFYRLYRQRIIEMNSVRTKNIDAESYMNLSSSNLRQESNLEELSKRKYIQLR